MPAGEYNGNSIIGSQRNQVIERLATGESVNSIATDLGHHWCVIDAIRRIESKKIEVVKERRTLQWEDTADLALDDLNDQLREKRGKLDPGGLATIAGIATDKIQAARGEASMIIRHQHEHVHIAATLEDGIAFCRARRLAREQASAAPAEGTDA